MQPKLSFQDMNDFSEQFAEVFIYYEAFYKLKIGFANKFLE